ncbi:EXO70A1 [Scenedesmus sp. PABB004]|nr:EXO70A1 [Scenedesmus sp. PABB004]
MHRAITACLPVLDGLLATAPGLAGALDGLARLGHAAAAAAGSLFSEYEEGVARDANKVLPLDGTVHPLAAQVVSYLKLLGALEGKCRAYRNDALGCLFMMNNAHYAAASVEACARRALRLLGRDWLERQKDAVEDWGARYHEATWGPVIARLKAEPPPDVGRLKLMLKEAFAAFNAAIERIYTHQSGWTIPDHMLRGAVKRVIKDDLLGPYQDFLRRHADVEFTSNPAKYIKYAVSDVASIIDDDLFETKAVSMTKLSLTREKLGAIVCCCCACWFCCCVGMRVTALFVVALLAVLAAPAACGPLDSITTAFQDASNAVTGFFGRAEQGLTGAAASATRTVDGAINGTTSAFNSVSGAANTVYNGSRAAAGAVTGAVSAAERTARSISGSAGARSGGAASSRRAWRRVRCSRSCSPLAEPWSSVTGHTR